MNITDPIFHDEAKAAAHIEASRWGGEPDLPALWFDPRHAAWAARRRPVCSCATIAATSSPSALAPSWSAAHVPLHKWLLATHLMAASKKGMSANQIDRMLGVTYKTAWFLCHRIREAMDGAARHGPLGGLTSVVEADETYVGGKAKNRATRKPAPKKAVVALVERDGHARSFHVANVNAKDLRGADRHQRRSRLAPDDRRKPRLHPRRPRV